MGLKINKPKRAGRYHTVTERLYRLPDGKVVPKSKAKGRGELYAIPGQEIPIAEADRLGLTKSKHPDKSKSGPTKQAAKAENKQREAAQNKGA